MKLYNNKHWIITLPEKFSAQVLEGLVALIFVFEQFSFDFVTRNDSVDLKNINEKIQLLFNSKQPMVIPFEHLQEMAFPRKILSTFQNAPDCRRPYHFRSGTPFIKED